MDRREFLATSGSLAAVAALAPHALGASSRIRDENAKPGTTDWLLTNTRTDASKIRCPWIEGYCSKMSVNVGETIEIKVSTNPPAKFTLDIYRLGYYGGKGGRLMERLGEKQGSPQSDPPVGDVRVRECDWETAHKLTIPTDWPSGVYLGKLTEERETLQ